MALHFFSLNIMVCFFSFYFPANLLSPNRKFLSKSMSTPLDGENPVDTNLITITSLSTGELTSATSEALKSIHDEMDLLVREGDYMIVFGFFKTYFLATASQ